MKGVLSILLIAALIPLVVSCAHADKAVSGTTKGTAETIEGVGKGAYDVGKGTAGTVKGTTGVVGYGLAGQKEKSDAAGAEAVDATKQIVQGAVVKPLEGLGKGLATIDEGIKKTTGGTQPTPKTK